MQPIFKLSLVILFAAASLSAQGIGGKAGIGGTAGIGGGNTVVVVNPSFVAAVGGTNQTGTAVSSVSTAGTLNVQVNDTVVLFCTQTASGTWTGSDTGSNTWTSKVSTTTGQHAITFVSTIVNANATDTLACNTTSATAYVTVLAVQLRNASPIDVAIASSCASACSDTSMTSSMFTTGQANEAIVYCATLNGATGTWSASSIGSASGILAVNMNNSTTGSSDSACSYAIVSTIQTNQTATMTLPGGSTSWGGSVTSFK
jgi:hypothetical protein